MRSEVLLEQARRGVGGGGNQLVEATQRTHPRSVRNHGPGYVSTNSNFSRCAMSHLMSMREYQNSWTKRVK